MCMAATTQARGRMTAGNTQLTHTQSSAGRISTTNAACGGGPRHTERGESHQPPPAACSLLHRHRWSLVPPTARGMLVRGTLRSLSSRRITRPALLNLSVMAEETLFGARVGGA